jgi:hypothetical protein
MPSVTPENSHHAESEQTRWTVAEFASIIRAHWPEFLVLTPIIAGIFVGLRVQMISGGDPTTFRYLAQGLDFQSAVFTQLIPMASTIILWLSLTMAIAWVTEDRTDKGSRFMALASALIFAILTGTTVAAGLALYSLIAAMITVWLLHRARRLRASAERRVRDYGRFFIVFIGGLVVFTLGELRPWLPAESAKIDGVPKARTIYTLTMKEDHITFLALTDGKIYTMPADKVSERVSCNEYHRTWHRTSLFLYMIDSGPRSKKQAMCPEMAD